MDTLELSCIDYIDKHLSAPIGVNTFYHYTTMEALDGILREHPQKGKEICLWATHNRYFNDPEELITGAWMQSEILYNLRPEFPRDEYEKKVIDRLKDLYILSLSQARDSLPLWNAYADKGNGVALGLKRQRSRNLQDVVVRCCYQPEELSKFVDEPYVMLTRLFTIYAPRIIKNDSYEYEKEVRVIGSFDESPILHRKKGYIKIPYKEVYFSKDQLESITLGPCVSTDENVAALKEFLICRGFEHVKIEKSEVPYRNL
jgi:hypothetical protein